MTNEEKKTLCGFKGVRIKSI